MTKRLVGRVQEAKHRGPLQRLHVIVCTYSEDASTVEACVRALVDAPLPVYAERTIYVADDGHKNAEGPKKRAFVDKMRQQGVLALRILAGVCCARLTAAERMHRGAAWCRSERCVRR